MARKKKQEELKYLQVPLPSGQSIYRGVKVSWSALNRRDNPDQGALAEESNIFTETTPYLAPAPIPQIVDLDTSELEYFNQTFDGDLELAYPFQNSHSLTFADGAMWIVRTDSSGYVYADKLTLTDGVPSAASTYKSEDADTGNIDNSYPGVVIFTKNTSEFNVLNNVVERKVLIPALAVSAEEIKIAGWTWRGTTGFTGFPYYNRGADDVYANRSDLTTAEKNAMYAKKVSSYLGCLWVVPWWDSDMGDYSKAKLCRATLDTSGDYWALTWEKLDNKFSETYAGYLPLQAYGGPLLSYSTTAHGRLVGLNGGKAYVSMYNDYAGWDLDTSTDFEDSHAWITDTQTNSSAGGDFTAIALYQNHIVCFKEDFIHEIVNTKNPFRVTDVYSIGTIDQRSVEVVGGLLLFAARDGVYAYNGSNPKLISYNLNIDKFNTAIAGTDGRYYYLYCTDGDDKPYMFAYDTQCACWSRQECIADESADKCAEIVDFAYHKDHGMYALVSCEKYHTTETSVDFNDSTYGGITAVKNGDGNATVTLSKEYDNEDSGHYVKITPSSTPIVYDTDANNTRNRYIAQMDLSEAIGNTKELTIEFDVDLSGSGSLWHISLADLSERDTDFFEASTILYNYPDPYGCAVTFGATSNPSSTDTAQVQLTRYANSGGYSASMCKCSGWIHIKLTYSPQTSHWGCIVTSASGSKLYGASWISLQGKPEKVTGLEFYTISDSTSLLIDNVTVTSEKLTADYDGETLYRIDSGVYGDWWFETDIFRRGIAKYSLTSYSTLDIVHLYKIQLLADISDGAWYKVYAMYDDAANAEFDETTAQLVYDSKGKTGRVTGRIKLRKSAARDVRLHFVGNGYIKLYELEYLVVDGGDLYK